MYLAKRSEEDAVGPAPSTDTAPDRPRLESALRRYLDRRLESARRIDGDFGRELAAEVVRFTLGGGRRMRPLVAWWGWLAAGGAAEEPHAGPALQACAALELVQTCALVHDDVMDGSPTRRGAPAVHEAYAAAHRAGGLAGDARRHGESLAVLAGDLALVWSDDMLYEALAEFPAEAAHRARAAWTGMRTEMMAGQFLDLRSQARRQRSEAAALRVDELKTASYSTEGPLHMGAALAGAPAGTVEALRSYGRDTGIAFQLRDDLLGVYGDPARTGKPAGEDLREGKCTVLLGAGVRLAGEQRDMGALALLDTVGSGDVDPEQVASALERVGARALVEERCRELAARAAARLKGLPAISADARRARDSLRALAVSTGEDLL
ncbi:polyprenyl synthetase family protein [Nocardiopsis algeriensis]|uniref:Geranylgeranyl diphosphate synthase type I n=1 Tax=Nocardiopsis algeriensis TaxID=1478215 RepID=A0A841IIW3_9ACTN|nr:polyprenyl synthetase family protein [Nocardiopsis algeriensis]MBB6118613.1 geranylgeranyl diphosphate synthase type I [Nocardiopsis algeriensis]